MSSNAKKRPALGKGLSALLENSDTDITTKSNQSGLVGSISMIAISDIEANPFNPRTHFEKEALLELAESIKEHGIIQPLTVRKMGRDNYQLISGERRFRACQIANIKEVPAYIRIANDQSMLEMALVENIQRENLNAIEIALSYDRLIHECNLTQEQLSQKLSKSRSAVTNFLRLLKLPAEIQPMLTVNNFKAVARVANAHNRPCGVVSFFFQAFKQVAMLAWIEIPIFDVEIKQAVIFRCCDCRFHVFLY